VFEEAKVARRGEMPSLWVFEAT